MQRKKLMIEIFMSVIVDEYDGVIACSVIYKPAHWN